MRTINREIEVEFNNLEVFLGSLDQLDPFKKRRSVRLSGKIVIDEIFIDNNGIGAYEYWGSKEYDYGSDYVADFKVVKLEHDEMDNAELTNQILEGALIDDDAFQKEVFAQLENER